MIAVALAALAVVVGVPLLRPPRARRVEPAPLVSAILDALPGGNCGVCGNGSCFGAASAIADGRAPASVCVTGGAATAAAVAKALDASVGRSRD